MADRTLRVKHTVDYRDRPLVSFGNLPGWDADMSPADIRALANAMLKAADECESLANYTKSYGPVRREYLLGA
jgi:hypothetical protein